MNVVVRPMVYADYRRVLHTATLLIVEGMLQSRGGVVNLLAWRAGFFFGAGQHGKRHEIY